MLLIRQPVLQFRLEAVQRQMLRLRENALQYGALLYQPASVLATLPFPAACGPALAPACAVPVSVLCCFGAYRSFIGATNAPIRSVRVGAGFSGPDPARKWYDFLFP